MLAFYRYLLSAAMVCLLSGTAFAQTRPATTQKRPAGTANRSAAPTVAPAPVTPMALPAAGERRLVRGDLIQISVIGEKDLTQTATVSSAGTVPMGWIGDVKVVGLTPTQAAEAIRKALRQYFRDPKVSVALAESRFSVLGAVRRPGQFVLQGDQVGVLDALAQAGGTEERANLRKVVLIRPTATGQMRAHIDVHSAMKGQGATHLPTMQSGDTLYVEKRKAPLGATLLTIAGAAASLAWILK